MTEDTATGDVSDATAHAGPERGLGLERGESGAASGLDAAFRRVSAAVVLATTRTELEAAVCEHLVAVSRYRFVCAADAPTWTGDADSWTAAGGAAGDVPTPPVLERTSLDAAAHPDDGPRPRLDPLDGRYADDWIVVPIAYRGTVYGAVGILPEHPPVGDGERDALCELGVVLGHAIDALENRRLLAAASVVELELGTGTSPDPLRETARRCECRLTLAGLVPEAAPGSVAFLEVAGAAPAVASDLLASATGDDVRVVHERSGGGAGRITWRVGDDSLLGHLAARGGRVTGVDADGDETTYTVEIASDRDARSLLDRVLRAFPGTRLAAKRELDRPVGPRPGFGEAGFETLTERQAEALEAAYRAGYFRWPRDHSAEEIADLLGVSRPTLQRHLRRAEQRLFCDLFDEDQSPRSDRLR